MSEHTGEPSAPSTPAELSAPSDPTVLGRTVPGWTLRVALAAAAAGVIALLIADGAAMVPVVLLAIVGGLGAILPASTAPAVLIAGTGVMVAFSGGEPLRAEVLAMVPVCHAVHVLAAVSGPIPPNARVQPAALRRPALRWLVVQVPVAALVGLTALALLPLRDVANPTVLLAAGIGAVLALLAIVVASVRIPGR